MADNIKTGTRVTPDAKYIDPAGDNLESVELIESTDGPISWEQIEKDTDAYNAANPERDKAILLTTAPTKVDASITADTVKPLQLDLKAEKAVMVPAEKPQQAEEQEIHNSLMTLEKAEHVKPKSANIKIIPGPPPAAHPQAEREVDKPSNIDSHSKPNKTTEKKKRRFNRRKSIRRILENRGRVKDLIERFNKLNGEP